jgi:hypothetical protein
MRLKKEKSAFRRNGDNGASVEDKTCVNDTAIVNKGRKDRKTYVEIKKP